jgi:hypothetical protein
MQIIYLIDLEEDNNLYSTCEKCIRIINKFKISSAGEGRRFNSTG